MRSTAKELWQRNKRGSLRNRK